MYEENNLTEEQIRAIAAKIAKLNDEFRQGMRPFILGEILIAKKSTHIPGTVVVTQGISALSSTDQNVIFAKVRNFNDFTEDNDPYEEHEFGSFDHGGQTIFWKIDYYDNTLEFGSPNPCDLTKTKRVLTIMLASEY